jgi:hypothetical protein
VFGVEAMPGSSERKVPGIPELPNTHMWQQLVREYVEPEIKIEYRTELLADRKVGVLVIPPCAQQPYVLKRTFGSLERGCAPSSVAARLRDRLLREDLEIIYARRYDYATRFAGLRVGFTAAEPVEVLALQRQRETALPSYEQSSKLRELIEARGYADQLSASGDSGIVRMVHVRVFGPDVPYESKSLEQLRRELEGAGSILPRAGTVMRATSVMPPKSI